MLSKSGNVKQSGIISENLVKYKSSKNSPRVIQPITFCNCIYENINHTEHFWINLTIPLHPIFSRAGYTNTRRNLIFLSKNNKSSNSHLSQLLKFVPINVVFIVTAIHMAPPCWPLIHTGKAPGLLLWDSCFKLFCFVLKSCDDFTLIYVHSFVGLPRMQRHALRKRLAKVQGANLWLGVVKHELVYSQMD